MKKLSLFIITFSLFGMHEVSAQWNTNGIHIYNSNSGNVGIGNNTPITLLHVQKDTTEPTITVQNLGGNGGATYTMIDNFSGAYWKFKATNSGGFKVRDQANLMDVIVIEPNSAANALYINGAGSVGLGTAAPAASAALDVSSTTKGFLPPRMTQAQINAIAAPADGLLVFNLTTGCFDYYFGGLWKSFCGTSESEFQCGGNIIKYHAAGSVAPVSKTVTYSTVSNIPGEPTKCWIASNLGADHQAIAVDDATEASAGWYWQFNHMQGYKHDGSTITPAWTITSIDENSDWLTANDPCSLLLGSGWRLPTSTEWTNVDASGGWTNWNGPWSSALKIHAAGVLSPSTGFLYERGSGGIYWNSIQSDPGSCLGLTLSSSGCLMGNYDKAHGLSARCLRE